MHTTHIVFDLGRARIYRIWDWKPIANLLTGADDGKGEPTQRLEGHARRERCYSVHTSHPPNVASARVLAFLVFASVLFSPITHSPPPSTVWTDVGFYAVVGEQSICFLVFILWCYSILYPNLGPSGKFAGGAQDMSR